MNKPPTHDELAQMMRQFRRDYGLNAEQAGQRLGLSRRTVEGIEQGRGYASAPILLGIALEHLLAASALARRMTTPEAASAERRPRRAKRA